MYHYVINTNNNYMRESYCLQYKFFCRKNNVDSVQHNDTFGRFTNFLTSARITIIKFDLSSLISLISVYNKYECFVRFCEE